MPDRVSGVLEKVADRTCLAVLSLGLVTLIVGALGYVPFLGGATQPVTHAWRLALVVAGGLVAAAGLALALLDERTTKVAVPTRTYVFCGLRKELRAGSVFQDFYIVRPGGNINAVSYLWADTYRACQINAEIPEGEKYLRVEFRNEPRSYPCNIAIRPQGEQALENTCSDATLTFEARVPPGIAGQDWLKEVSLALRVVNGWVQHWEYVDKPGEYVQFPIRSSEWTKFSADLGNGNWQLFQGDGNLTSGPAKPGFEVITAVVFEVGSYDVPGRPGDGQGVVDIRDIRLERNS